MSWDNYQCEGQTSIFDFLQPKKEHRRKISLLSLFSGIGAFEKALDNLQIPYDLVGYCEIDKYASKSYAAIHEVPETMNLGDITKVDEQAHPKDIDLITYGFPCQDISLAGKQKGLFNADGTQTRSGLFFEALRIIEATQPRVAIAENVNNLTGKKFSQQFKVVLESLEAAGYNNYWQVLNAKDYGIPQNRKRVFIVSIRSGIDKGMFQFPRSFPLELRLKDMLDDVVDEKYYLSKRRIKSLFEHKRRNAEKGNGFGARIVSCNDIASSLTTSPHKSAGQYLMDEQQRIRILTPKECFRLMGFDDSDFEKADAVNSNTQLYKQAGNSIVVPVVEHIISAVFDCGAL